MDAQIKAYREHLVLAEQKAQEDFDKTVITLSGGALGISFAFVTDIVGTESLVRACQLYWAWIAWGFSLICVLFSYFFSHLALRKAIKQVDDKTFYERRIGAGYDIATAALNISGAILFVIGVIMMIFFVRSNLGV
jgi:hypothetical protein